MAGAVRTDIFPDFNDSGNGTDARGVESMRRAARLPKYQVLAGIISAVLAAPLLAQSPGGGSAPAAVAEKPSFESRLTAAAYPLHMDAGKLSGTGASILQDAIAQAQFVLIGEDHITREIPQFTAAVCDDMAASGALSAMVFETSPAVARFVQGSLGKTDRLQQMATLQKRYPDSAVFLNVRQENDAAEHCAGVSRAPEFQIWGVDQEFLGSAGWIFERMLATQPGPKARAAIQRMQAQEHADTEEARKTGDPSKLFMLAVPEAEIESLSAAVREDGTAATGAELRELTESRAIYLQQGTMPSESNARRARLMKQNFVASYRGLGQTSEKPRVLLKLGDWHLYKGINPLHQRDLGNFVAEFADGQKSSSLHILVSGSERDARAVRGL